MKDYIITALSYLRRRSKRKLIRYSYQLRGKKGLEIGGPSSQYALMGNFPVYLFAKQIDGVNYSNETVWEGSISEGQTYRYHNKVGFQYIKEAIDLNNIVDESYDFVLSCHSLEHVANPLLALREWMRVLKPGGLINLILPDRRYTFDINRPYTTFKHLLADYEAGVKEDDPTHFEEILKAHQPDLDPEGKTREQLAELLKDNLINRRAHHHVFDLPLVNEMLTWVGCEVLYQQAATPFHLITVAQKKY